MRLESLEKDDEVRDAEPPNNLLQVQLISTLDQRRGSVPTHMLTGIRPDKRHSSVSPGDTQTGGLDLPKEGKLIIFILHKMLCICCINSHSIVAKLFCFLPYWDSSMVNPVPEQLCICSH